jgi:hypothetical protein
VQNGVDHVRSFIAAAEAFIAWVEEYPRNSGELIVLHRLLADVQAALLRLPAPTIDGADPDAEDDGDTESVAHHHERWKTITEGLSALPITHYQIVFDSLTQEEADAQVTGWLADDLADIYLDVREGLEHANAGRASEALWEWRFGYFSHWGRHLVHAQNAIWDYLQANGFEDNQFEALAKDE